MLFIIHLIASWKISKSQSMLHVHGHTNGLPALGFLRLILWHFKPLCTPTTVFDRNIAYLVVYVTFQILYIYFDCDGNVQCEQIESFLFFIPFYRNRYSCDSCRSGQLFVRYFKGEYENGFRFVFIFFADLLTGNFSFLFCKIIGKTDVSIASNSS